MTMTTNKQDLKEYIIFHRKWWKDSPDGLIPNLGRKTILGYEDTEDEARKWCKEWNGDYYVKKKGKNKYCIMAEYTKTHNVIRYYNLNKQKLWKM